MSQSAWKQQQQMQQGKNSKARREFMVLMVLVILGAGGFMVLSPAHLPQPDRMSGSAMSQMLLQADPNNPIPRSIPANYKVKGSVDDRYTVASDPKSGSLVIHDTIGGIGTNTTSVDGDRAKLANDMVDLEKYAEDNHKKLSSDAYYWLKKVARTGMKLAFGTPGAAPSTQPAIKQDILAEFHNISANPAKSFMANSKFLALEAVFQRPEAAYLANSDTANTNFFSYDPVSSPLISSSLALPSLQTQLSITTLEPSLTSLSTVSSPYVYTATPVLTASTLTPVTTTSSTAPTATLSPTMVTSVTAVSPTTSSTLTTTTTTTGPVSVASYYDATLGTHLSTPTVTTTSTTIAPISSPIMSGP